MWFPKLRPHECHHVPGHRRALGHLWGILWVSAPSERSHGCAPEFPFMPNHSEKSLFLLPQPQQYWRNYFDHFVSHNIPFPAFFPPPFVNFPFKKAQSWRSACWSSSCRMPPSHVFPEWRYNTLLGSIKYQVITHTKNPHQTSMLLSALIRCKRKIRLQQSTFFWIYITLNNSGCFDWHKAFRDGFASSLVPFPLINIYKQFSVLCVLCCFFFFEMNSEYSYLSWLTSPHLYK